MFFSAKSYLIFRCLSGAAVISVATVDKRTISSILMLVLLLLLLLVVVVVFLRRMVTKLGLVTKCSPKYRPPLYTWEVFGLHT